MRIQRTAALLGSRVRGAPVVRTWPLNATAALAFVVLAVVYHALPFACAAVVLGVDALYEWNES
jgi:hypothetical protein